MSNNAHQAQKLLNIEKYNKHIKLLKYFFYSADWDYPSTFVFPKNTLSTVAFLVHSSNAMLLSK
jgi:hypothetical protein